jgi:hypothetical protein
MELTGRCASDQSQVLPLETFLFRHPIAHRQHCRCQKSNWAMNVQPQELVTTKLSSTQDYAWNRSNATEIE